ncbi:MAG: coproporphyrinogen III oxidase family protein [Synergistaceae bacterium]|jgi:oxygen-independent coproporphyrinogen-3 oxidase|nr:coproporphyrinogen III oxidase family protein [Synergistaceae bacterium]
MPPSFSLYLHVPFCLSKCGYCSFYSRPLAGCAAAPEAWLAALSREAGRLSAVWGGPIPLCTAYVGGGTPSVLSVGLWRRLNRILEGAFDFSGLAECTVEANPCSLTDGHLALWRGSFVTRVSLGVQSLRNEELSWLGRRHDAETALAALGRALSYGFDVSADLMFGLPSSRFPFQTLRTWHDSLRRVLASGVGHVSAYQLTPEPGTPLGKSNPSLPDGYSPYRFAQWYLPRKGLEQYEIASFARPGRECRHNLAYWRQENVLALGPAAWGYLVGGRGGAGFRYRNAPTLEEYGAAAGARLPVAGAERLEGRAKGIEAAVLGLRTKWGIDTEAFTARFGETLTGAVLEVLRGMPPRLVRFEDGRASLTPAGMRVANPIWAEIADLRAEGTDTWKNTSNI